MKTLSKHRLISILIAILLTLLALPALAQDDSPPTASADVTAEATVPAAPVTIIDAEGDVILQTPADTSETPETPVEPEPWWAKYATPLLMVAGILTAALIAVNKWLSEHKTNVNTVTFFEQLYTWSPAFVKKGAVAFLKQVILLGENLDEVLTEATDGTPYVVKISKVPSASTPPDLPSSGASSIWPTSGK